MELTKAKELEIHGEPWEATTNASRNVEEDDGHSRYSFVSEEIDMDDNDFGDFGSDPYEFANVIGDGDQPVYPGCRKYTILSVKMVSHQDQSKDSGSKKNGGKELGMVPPQENPSKKMKSSKKMKFASSSAETEPTSTTTISDNSKSGRASRLSKDFESVHSQHAQIREKLEYNHRLSRKGYAGLEDQLEETMPGVEIDRSTLWKRARQDKHGNIPDPKVAEKAKLIVIIKVVDYSNMEAPSSLKSLCRYVETTLVPQDKTLHFTIDKEVFGLERVTFLLPEDITQFAGMEEIGATVIAVYMRYLHDVLKQANMCSMVGFIDPATVSASSGTIADRSRLLAARLQKTDGEQIFLMPYNPGYKNWTFHGEPWEATTNASRNVEEDDGHSRYSFVSEEIDMDDNDLNRTRPEGCIAEQYIAEEAVEFCTQHLSNVSTVGVPSSQKMGLSKPLSGCTVSVVDQDLLNQAHLYVLENTEEVLPYIEQHMIHIKTAYPKFRKRTKWLQDKHNSTFIQWLRFKVQSELEEDNHGVSENLRWLAAGPNMAVPLYRSYLIKGIKFNIKAQDDGMPNVDTFDELVGELGGQNIRDGCEDIWIE
ncbi:hypothetical protein L7F22_035808 [Adiantum nelumboides]|nr:hypothetical protein [Adiantum nelumboides]